MPERKIFLMLIVLVSFAFGWLLWPLFGAVFWAVTLSIVFHPLYRRLLKATKLGKTFTAALMILGIILILVIPVFLIIAALVNELSIFLASVQSGEINLHVMFQQGLAAVPEWSKTLLSRLGFGNLTVAQESIAASITAWIGENTPQMLSFGQNTASVLVSLGVTLYLTFFLFRDGDHMLRHLKSALPMAPKFQNNLLKTFTLVVRATVKGDILVALMQGALGGLGFWLLGVHAAVLWMVLMAFMSLFPVFGAAVVWAPVALYFFASGQIWQSIALIAYGVLVIGLIDNFVRPYLVGQATRMPDYVVLIATIGGIATFGVQGFITGPVIAAMFIAVWSTFLSLDRLEDAGPPKP